MLLVSEPSLGDEERTALAEVIDSNWITMGDRVRDFELAFSAEHGLADAAAVSSCTAGLHLCLAALGIGPGDEVLVPSLSFVATANCVLYVGATPVFVDIRGLHLPSISIEDAARKCSARTKALVVMHYAGYLHEQHAWQEFAASRGLLLIEDAAHAAGAPGVGTFGDAAAFSFYGNKNMTTAEGGMVCARDPDVMKRMRDMRSHGMTSGTRQRLHARAPSYDVTSLGWNYRMDELRASVGLAQLRRLSAWNSRRAELTATYRDAIAEHCPDVVIPFSNIAAPSAYHILPVVLPDGADRDAVMGRMHDAGVQTTNHYPPIHLLSFYRDNNPCLVLPITEEFARREVTLPLHPKMHEADVWRVVDTLTEALLPRTRKEKVA